MDNRREKNGFTLTELLVVLTIIMLLTGLVGVNVVRHQREARVSAAKIQVKLLAQAVRQYQVEQGAPPTREQGLEALVRRPTRAPVPERYPPEGYLDSREVPLDPWGRPYEYIVPGRDGVAFEVVSFGRDGEPGGEGDAADISSMDL
jgi:general secretion pathway protein G